MAGFVLAIVTGAFLLFQVQPIMGKWILPWFGGGPGVWSACLLFFQVVLLAGYFYAHLLSARFRPGTQAVLHLALLGLALVFLPVTPSEAWKPDGVQAPTLQIVLLLLGTVGLPYFLLASTGPLLQRWWSMTRTGPVPYRLYALSNAGSLIALLSYPFLIEPNLARRQQSAGWSWAFVLYCLFCAWSARVFWRANQVVSAASPQGEEENVGTGGTSAASVAGIVGTRGTLPEVRASVASKILWVVLPFCASVLLLATTNKISQDVAVVPFLWILPLSAYLLSFIIAFDSPRWYSRVPYTVALVLALGAAAWGISQGTDFNIKKLVAIYTGALFICCTVCHAELYRIRPGASELTLFYLAIAAGGALGGLFVAVLAPVMFRGYYELHWGLFSCAVFFLVVCVLEWLGRLRSPDATAAVGRDGSQSTPFTEATVPSQVPVPQCNREWFWLAVVLTVLGIVALDRYLNWKPDARGLKEAHAGWLRFGAWAVFLTVVAGWVRRRGHRHLRYWPILAILWLGLGTVALGVVLWKDATKADYNVVHRSRSFYGTLKVTEYDRSDPFGRYFLLQHGGITHGIQFTDYEQSTWPTTYYAEGSGLALAFEVLPENARRLGVVGLGTGSIAVYGKPGDYLRFYEIDPAIHRLATRQFSYLVRCRGTVEVVLGDARLSMERELPQELDLLALDAFSGDAIPVHLLTREAFSLYDRHLRENGIIAIHISNHYLDLEPVVLNLAREFGYEAARIDYDEDDTWWKYASTWVLLSRDPEKMRVIRDSATPFESKLTGIPLWTDDFASLYQILK